MHLLYATDRLSVRGGADHHLRDVITAVAAAGHRVTVAAGRVDAALPGVETVRVRGLGRAVADSRRLSALDAALDAVDVVHVQNVMNPVALQRLVDTRRAVVTVQDHRVFCPGAGKTLPDGARCVAPMGVDTCAGCLPDADYRGRILALTAARRQALVGARRVVLSQYMADELAAAGLPGAAVIPPWIAAAAVAPVAGRGFVLGGRLVAHKAPALAWRGWRASGTAQPLIVAGAGREAAQLHGATAVGWLDRAALHALLAGSRALLMPARWQEPFGILGAEALACGTPVILQASGGSADWAGAGCIAVRDEAGFAAAIAALSRDPARALALGRAGQRWVRTRFTAAAILPRLLRVYAEARAGPPATTAPR